MGKIPALIEALLDPDIYPHRPHQVKLIQTHISYVILTGSYVLKIKKPVNLGFLDFTTLDKRRVYCEQELILNRRLSPEIYVDIVEIKKDGDQFHIGGRGELVEVAVRMRELPQEKALSQLLERNGVTEDMMDDLAKIMANFHQSAETSPRIADFGTAENIFVSIDENFRQTERYVGITLSQRKYQALKRYSYRFLERRDLFEKRIEEGKIRDCHGDFHCQNVYFLDKIYILDCIEFNERFRYIDVASDVAFLTMDLDLRGYRGFSNRILNTYLQFTGDYGLLAMLDFYKIYRAYVRGKVGSFELDIKGLLPQERMAIKKKAEKYFDLAYQYLKKKETPFLIATTGIIGSGKSYISKELASRIDAVVLRSDAVRKKLLQLSPAKHMYEPFGEGIYSENTTVAVYDRLIREAENILGTGKVVIIDASFSKKWQRNKVVDLAEGRGYPYFFIYCYCHDNIIKERLRIRSEREHDISNGRPELFETYKVAYEPPDEVAPTHIYKLDSERGINQVIKSVKRALKKLL